MKALKKTNWLVVFLILVSIYQSYLVFSDYGLSWFSRIWRNRELTSFQRSEIFYLGNTGRQYMDFIRSVVPEDKTIILPERSAQFSSQSILFFYLLPRSVQICDCDTLGGKCNPCLQAPDVYIPVTKNFPPENAVGSKKYIPFSGESDYYLGIYVPQNAPAVADPTLFDNQAWSWFAVVKEMILLGMFAFAGFLLVRVIYPQNPFFEAIVLSTPLSMGTLTWLVFLISWAGVKINPLSILSVYGLLLLLLILLAWRLRVKLLPENPLLSFSINRLKTNLRDIPVVVSYFLLGILLVALAVITVGRTYSTFDDIAIWAQKGYGIANAQSIFAFGYLGGHGLAYPLNLPLSIAIFKQISGDTIPGSKILYLWLGLMLLVESYCFYRYNKIQKPLALSSVLFLISIPVVFLYGTLGFANLPFTAYLVTGVYWMVRGFQRQDEKAMLLSGFLFGFAGWTRPEGFLFSLALIIALYGSYWIVRRQVYKSWTWLLPAISIPGIWLIFAQPYIQADQAGSALKSISEQMTSGKLSLTPIWEIFRFARVQLIDPQVWGVGIPVGLAIMTAALLFKPVRSNPVAWMLILASWTAMIFLSLLFWIESAFENNFNGFLVVSFDRAFLPIAFLMMASILVSINTLFQPKLHNFEHR